MMNMNDINESSDNGGKYPKSLFLIDDKIEFNLNKRTLKNRETGLEAKLFLPASLILFFLIDKCGDSMSHTDLIRMTWKDTSHVVSTGTLHQNILNIRSTFKKVGCKRNVIISLPRRGFRYSTEVNCKLLSNITKVGYPWLKKIKRLFVCLY